MPQVQMKKTAKVLYDDEMTFMLADFAYKHVVHNDVYVNADYGSSFPGAVKENGGNDWIAPYEGKTSAWSLADNGDKTYSLTLSNGEFMGYYSGPVVSYTITALTRRRNDPAFNKHRARPRMGAEIHPQRIRARGYCTSL